MGPIPGCGIVESDKKKNQMACASTAREARTVTGRAHRPGAASRRPDHPRQALLRAQSSAGYAAPGLGGCGLRIGPHDDGVGDRDDFVGG